MSPNDRSGPSRIGRRTFLRDAAASGLALGTGATLIAGTASAHSTGNEDHDRFIGGVELSAVYRESGGAPDALGVRVPAATLADLPAESDAAHLDAPGDTPFEFLGVGWQPTGHPPAGVYDVPHFDFHLYRVPWEQVDAISGSPALFGGSDVPQPLPPEQYPPAYVPDHAVVTDMGQHWFDSQAPEFQGGEFTRTYIYGSYERDITFVEPMVTKTFLDGLDPGKAERVDVRTPQAFPESGYYPTEYVISRTTHDGTDVYEVTVEGFEEFPEATV